MLLIRGRLLGDLLASTAARLRSTGEKAGVRKLEKYGKERQVEEKFVAKVA